ncbi:MAG TPA: ATP-binding cassette domain-containing protein [Chloroflexota bacterium]|nr:ATP-binding cassette domain-containing protein [Chloroflexota bacterium]
MSTLQSVSENTAPLPPAGTTLLETRGIVKSFGAVQALRGVDFEARSGEVTALLGDNGAGKSTLIKCIAGTYIPDCGEILVGGVPQHFHTPSDATRAGIETVYQDLALCDNLDVVANLFLGREQVHTWIPSVFRTMSEERMEKFSTDALSTLRINIPSVRNQVAQLSGGQRQSVAVAKAVLWSPKVVILDEPTAALGVAQTRQVLDLVLRLKERGLAVVIITHNMVDAFEVADIAIVMRLGRRVARLKVSEVTPEDVVAAITGARTFDDLAKA